MFFLYKYGINTTYGTNYLASLRIHCMEKSKVTIGLVLSVFAFVVGVATTSVYATDGSSTPTPKTQEQIEAYKKEMQAKKAEMIKEYKERQAAETKGMTPAQIREYKLEEARKAGIVVVEESKENRDAKQAESKTIRETKLAEQKAEREEKRAEKLAEFVAVLAEKVGSYYERLSQLSEKLQTRITKLKEEGENMTASQAKLEEADETLEVAYQNALAIIEEIKSSDISSEEGLGIVISKVKELKNPFRSALEAYKEVAKEIRTAVSAENDK